MAALAHRQKHSIKISIGDDVAFIPNIDELDQGAFDLIYDADLDEFSILLFGRSRRSTQCEVGPSTAVLVDPFDKTVVGFVLYNFTAAVAKYPYLAQGLQWATRLSGENIIEPVHPINQQRSRWEQSIMTVRSRIAGINVPLDVRDLVRSVEQGCFA